MLLKSLAKLRSCAQDDLADWKALMAARTKQGHACCKAKADLKLRLHFEGDSLISGEALQGHIILQRPEESLPHYIVLQIFACTKVCCHRSARGLLGVWCGSTFCLNVSSVQRDGSSAMLAARTTLDFPPFPEGPVPSASVKLDESVFPCMQRKLVGQRLLKQGKQFLHG